MSQAAAARRLSASVLLLRRHAADPHTGQASPYNYRILCQKRGANISRGGMVTFPGGVFESSDADIRVTAARELFEETGILLTQPPQRQPEAAAVTSQQRAEAARKALRDDPTMFKSLLDGLQCSPRTTDLLHYCTFTTPTFEKRQYETHFFLAEVSEDECTSMSADGSETASLLWLDPREAIEKQTKNEIRFLPPQYYIFDELSKEFDIKRVVEQLKIDAKEGMNYCSGSSSRVSVDCRGFPEMRPHRVAADSSNTVATLALPFDEHHDTWPGSPGQRHRVVCGIPIGEVGGGYRVENNVADKPR